MAWFDATQGQAVSAPYAGQWTLVASTFDGPLAAISDDPEFAPPAGNEPITANRANNNTECRVLYGD